MKFNFGNKLPWERIEKILRVIEVAAVVMAACTVIYLPNQIKDWQDSQKNREFEILLKLEDKFDQEKNQEIYSSITKGEPIFSQNDGKFIEIDIDEYLDDLMTVAEYYDKGLITFNSIYEWFYYYFVPTFDNKEIQAYIAEVRKDCKDCWEGLDAISNKLIELDQKNNIK
jgi:hypothetical protein